MQAGTATVPGCTGKREPVAAQSRPGSAWRARRVEILVVHVYVLRDEERLDSLDNLDGDVERYRDDVLERDET